MCPVVLLAIPALSTVAGAIGGGLAVGAATAAVGAGSTALVATTVGAFSVGAGVALGAGAGLVAGGAIDWAGYHSGSDLTARINDEWALLTQGEAYVAKNNSANYIQDLATRLQRVAPEKFDDSFISEVPDLYAPDPQRRKMQRTIWEGENPDLNRQMIALRTRFDDIDRALTIWNNPEEKAKLGTEGYPTEEDLEKSLVDAHYSIVRMILGETTQFTDEFDLALLTNDWPPMSTALQEQIEIIGGVVQDGRILFPNESGQLAEIPPRDVLKNYMRELFDSKGMSGDEENFNLFFNTVLANSTFDAVNYMQKQVGAAQQSGAANVDKFRSQVEQMQENISAIKFFDLYNNGDAQSQQDILSGELNNIGSPTKDFYNILAILDRHEDVQNHDKEFGNEWTDFMTNIKTLLLGVVESFLRPFMDQVAQQFGIELTPEETDQASRTAQNTMNDDLYDFNNRSLAALAEEGLLTVPDSLSSQASQTVESLDTSGLEALIKANSRNPDQAAAAYALLFDKDQERAASLSSDLITGDYSNAFRAQMMGVFVGEMSDPETGNPEIMRTAFVDATPRQRQAWIEVWAGHDEINGIAMIANITDGTSPVGKEALAAYIERCLEVGNVEAAANILNRVNNGDIDNAIAAAIQDPDSGITENSTDQEIAAAFSSGKISYARPLSDLVVGLSPEDLITIYPQLEANSEAQLLVADRLTNLIPNSISAEDMQGLLQELLDSGSAGMGKVSEITALMIDKDREEEIMDILSAMELGEMQATIVSAARTRADMISFSSADTGMGQIPMETPTTQNAPTTPTLQ